MAISHTNNEKMVVKWVQKSIDTTIKRTQSTSKFGLDSDGWLRAPIAFFAKVVPTRQQGLYCLFAVK
jgi:hypothetical protein